jgi:hypothetical protein
LRELGRFVGRTPGPREPQATPAASARTPQRTAAQPASAAIEPAAADQGVPADQPTAAVAGALNAPPPSAAPTAPTATTAPTAPPAPAVALADAGEPPSTDGDEEPLPIPSATLPPTPASKDGAVEPAAARARR